jgi:hypothetical protein
MGGQNVTCDRKTVSELIPSAQRLNSLALRGFIAQRPVE